MRRTAGACRCYCLDAGGRPSNAADAAAGARRARTTRWRALTTHFFEYLDFALQFAPALPEETDIRAKLARIGIGAGKTFDFKDLSAEHKAAVLLGMKEGEDKIDDTTNDPSSTM